MCHGYPLCRFRRLSTPRADSLGGARSGETQQCPGFAVSVSAGAVTIFRAAEPARSERGESRDSIDLGRNRRLGRYPHFGPKADRCAHSQGRRPPDPNTEAHDLEIGEAGGRRRLRQGRLRENGLRSRFSCRIGRRLQRPCSGPARAWHPICTSSSGVTNGPGQRDEWAHRP